MKIIWTETAGSTNDELKKLALGGAEDGTVYIAGTQTAGRGRRGRSFLSPEGGAYVSVLLRSGDVSGLTCAAAVAVRRVAERCGVQAMIKWPNDLTVNGKKLCGILTELVTMGGESFAIVGVGMNVCPAHNEFNTELWENITSLSAETGVSFDCRTVAVDIAESVIEMSCAPRGQYMEQYRKYCSTIGLRVGGGDGKRGTAVGVTDEGALILKNDEGNTEYWRFGEVTVR